MRYRYQRGSGALVAIMLLLVLGLLLLNSLHRQLDSVLLLSNNESRYLLAYNQALSSLNWGLSRTWAISLSPGSKLSKSTLLSKVSLWHCEEQAEQGVKACIKPATSRGFFVMKGESQVFAMQSPVTLYQRVVPKNPLIKTGKNKMVGVIHGMLDFCPERDEKFCAE